jgi:hypothetical protein
MTEGKRVVRRRRRLTEEEKERIIDYRKEGRSYSEISVLMGGLPISTIERYARTVKRGQMKTEPRRPAVSEPQSPPRETAPAEELPPKQTIHPDWYHELQDIVRGDHGTPADMFDAAVPVLPQMSEPERASWMYVIKTVWERKKNKEEKSIQDFIDMCLLAFIRRNYPEQVLQFIASMRRGDRILPRLDEVVLLLKELLKEVKRREL